MRKQQPLPPSGGRGCCLCLRLLCVLAANGVLPVRDQLGDGNLRADYLDKLTDAYPDRSRAEIEADHGVEAFAISEYADYLAQVIDGYVAGTFKKVLAK